jgi:hypothetical protein
MTKAVVVFCKAAVPVCKKEMHFALNRSPAEGISEPEEGPRRRNINSESPGRRFRF